MQKKSKAVPGYLQRIMGKTSEEIRLRYLYRDMIVRGKVNLSLDSAKGLVGPDCAFHLYSVMDEKRIKPHNHKDRRK